MLFRNPKTQGVVELLIATLIWGFGFVATQWTLKFFDSASINFLRFFLAFLIGLVIVKIFAPAFGYSDSKPKLKIIFSDYAKIAAGPGVLLGLMIAMQTWGLEFTSVTNSGFITTLYVVFVPLISYVAFKLIPRPWHYLWLLLSLVGAAFMMELKLTDANKGDLYTLICAVLGAAQIVWVERVSKKIKSAFIFNVFQSFWAFLATLAFWPIYGRIHWSLPDAKGSLGLMSLVFGSTLFAFALQIKAQKKISANLASILFLLESPFAALFGFILLNESMGFLKVCGAILILGSALGAVRTSMSKS